MVTSQSSGEKKYYCDINLISKIIVNQYVSVIYMNLCQQCKLGSF